MVFAQQWPRTGQPPSRWLLVPVALIALVIVALVIAYLRLQASYGAPPRTQLFDGLPVAGSLRDARREGFTYCIDFGNSMRCRGGKVMLLNHGPYNAAVDLRGGDGRGGFRQLTLWHDRDKDAAGELAWQLQAEGWQSCLTMAHGWGDQHILRREGSPVRISIDMSYYSRPRIRIIPERFASKVHCE